MVGVTLQEFHGHIGHLLLPSNIEDTDVCIDNKLVWGDNGIWLGYITIDNQLHTA